MPSRLSLFMFSLVGILCAQPVAASLTLTGADLLSNASLQFPIGNVSASGTSLICGESEIDFGKCAVLPLGPFGIAFTGAPITVSFSLNLTRLTDNWDALVTLGDGSYLLGASAGDNSGGQGAAEVMADLGDRGSNPNPTATILFTNAGFPAIGDSFDVVFSFLLEATQTTMDVSFGAASSSHTFSQAFTPGAPLSLSLIRDNESYERYQLNSITLTCSPFPGGGNTGGCFPGPGPFPAPEPNTLALLGVGLVGLFASRRRSKQLS